MVLWRVVKRIGAKIARPKIGYTRPPAQAFSGACDEGLEDFYCLADYGDDTLPTFWQTGATGRSLAFRGLRGICSVPGVSPSSG